MVECISALMYCFQFANWSGATYPQFTTQNNKIPFVSCTLLEHISNVFKFQKSSKKQFQSNFTDIYIRSSTKQSLKLKINDLVYNTTISTLFSNLLSIFFPPISSKIKEWKLKVKLSKQNRALESGNPKWEGKIITKYIKNKSSL